MRLRPRGLARPPSRPQRRKFRWHSGWATGGVRWWRKDSAAPGRSSPAAWWLNSDRWALAERRLVPLGTPASSAGRRLFGEGRSCCIKLGDAARCSAPPPSGRSTSVSLRRWSGRGASCWAAVALRRCCFGVGRKARELAVGTAVLVDRAGRAGRFGFGARAVRAAPGLAEIRTSRRRYPTAAAKLGATSGELWTTPGCRGLEKNRRRQAPRRPPAVPDGFEGWP